MITTTIATLIVTGQSQSFEARVRALTEALSPVPIAKLKRNYRSVFDEPYVLSFDGGDIDWFVHCRGLEFISSITFYKQTTPNYRGGGGSSKPIPNKLQAVQNETRRLVKIAKIPWSVAQLNSILGSARLNSTGVYQLWETVDGYSSREWGNGLTITLDGRGKASSVALNFGRSYAPHGKVLPLAELRSIAKKHLKNEIRTGSIRWVLIGPNAKVMKLRLVFTVVEQGDVHSSREIRIAADTGEVLKVN